MSMGNAILVEPGLELDRLHISYFYCGQCFPDIVKTLIMATTGTVSNVFDWMHSNHFMSG